ncbi:hypothetical protein ANO11243_093380 [Dothideomycetidae sp. 11243]|nr:hypothetical protein ANO11243_093380 [fungal sp. No.11243]
MTEACTPLHADRPLSHEKGGRQLLEGQNQRGWGIEPRCAPWASAGGRGPYELCPGDIGVNALGDGVWWAARISTWTRNGRVSTLDSVRSAGIHMPDARIAAGARGWCLGWAFFEVEMVG